MQDKIIDNFKGVCKLYSKHKQKSITPNEQEQIDYFLSLEQEKKIEIDLT
jgi:hypothetical protein